MRRFLTSLPPKKQMTPQEMAAAFQKLGDGLKIPKGNENNEHVFASSQKARDMRDLVKKRHLDQFQGKRFTEVDLKFWFTEMDQGRLPDAPADTQAMMRRLHTKYKSVL